MNGPHLFNDGIQNLRGFCERQSFCLNWAWNHGPRVKGPILYPLSCRYLPVSLVLMFICRDSLHIIETVSRVRMDRKYRLAGNNFSPAMINSKESPQTSVCSS